jgi:hypothetical protein
MQEQAKANLKAGDTVAFAQCTQLADACLMQQQVLENIVEALRNMPTTAHMSVEEVSEFVEEAEEHGVDEVGMCHALMTHIVTKISEAVRRAADFKPYPPRPAARMATAGTATGRIILP